MASSLPISARNPYPLGGKYSFLIDRPVDDSCDSLPDPPTLNGRRSQRRRTIAAGQKQGHVCIGEHPFGRAAAGSYPLGIIALTGFPRSFAGRMSGGVPRVQFLLGVIPATRQLPPGIYSGRAQSRSGLLVPSSSQ